MAKRECPFCREIVKEGATICKHCKNELSPLPHKKWNQTWKGLLLIIFILSVITGAFEGRSVHQPTITPAYAQISEKTGLLKSYFGDYRKAKKIKKLATESLSVWESHTNYSKTLSPTIQAVMLDGVEKLIIDYDEMWIWENDEELSTAEKTKFKGKNDIHKLYWKQNKVQACTIEKYYESDPFTRQKLSKPSHKIWNIYNRDYILRKLSKS